MTDDKTNYTPEELEWIDNALLHIGGFMAAECMRRGPDGVAATTRKIVEALVKERRGLRPVDDVPESLPMNNAPDNDGKTAEQAQFEITLRQKDERIAELEKNLDRETLYAEQLVTQNKLLKTCNKEQDALTEKLEKRVADLGAEVAGQKRMVAEWFDAVDALHNLWPAGVDYEKDNPTNAEWIRDLVTAREQQAKLQTLNKVQHIRQRLAEASKSVGGEHSAVLYPDWNVIINEALDAMMP